jgi:hypothetical protein
VEDQGRHPHIQLAVAIQAQLWHESQVAGGGCRVCQPGDCFPDKHEAVGKLSGSVAGHNTCGSVPLRLPAAHASGCGRQDILLPLPKGALVLGWPLSQGEAPSAVWKLLF